MMLVQDSNLKASREVERIGKMLEAVEASAREDSKHDQVMHLNLCF